MYLLYIIMSSWICVTQVALYETYSALNSIVFLDLEEPNDTVHSEYTYGKCATKSKTLVYHDHITDTEIIGKLVIRGYLNSTILVNCIYLRSESPVTEMVKYKPNRFTMCLCKIRYQFDGKQFTIHFYEWYLPPFMKTGIDWDIYFFSS